MMLRIKFGFGRPTGLRDIHVLKVWTHILTDTQTPARLVFLIFHWSNLKRKLFINDDVTNFSDILSQISISAECTERFAAY